MNEEPPQVVLDVQLPVSEVARQSYLEAVALHPEPNVELGAQSTDLPLPSSVRVVSLADLVEHTAVSSSTFSEVLARRRSIRTFATLSASDLGQLLLAVFRLQGFTPSDDGGTRRFRPVPSAGGRHPVVPLLMINDVEGLDRGLWRVDTDGERLLHISQPAHGDTTALDSAWVKVRSAGTFTQRPPAVVLLAARFDATLARYPLGASLVWRDAGVTMGFLQLTATNLGLGSCLLGTAGLLDREQLMACGLTGSLVGDVGAVAVGSLPKPPAAMNIPR